MNHRIYQFKILSSCDKTIENKSLKIFIDLVKDKRNPTIIFTDCDELHDEFYLIWEKEKAEQYIHRFIATGIEMTHRDITNATLNGKNDALFIQTFSNEKNVTLLNSFLEHYFTTDALLEKITFVGSFNLLNKTEQMYLENYSKLNY